MSDFLPDFVRASPVVSAVAALSLSALLYKAFRRSPPPSYKRDFTAVPPSAHDPAEPPTPALPAPFTSLHASIHDFDAVLEAALARRPSALYVLVSAAEIPFTGEPWCPDSRRAEPCIRRAVVERHRGEESDVVIVVARVKRYLYAGNKEHPFRTHPLLRLQACPQLYRWGAGGPEWSLVEDECYDEAKLKEYLRRR